VVTKLVSLFAAMAVAVIAQAQPQVLPDRGGDAVIRRTDLGDDGPVSPANTSLPDLVETRLGRFAPNSASTNLFVGAWSAAGGFVRLDLDYRGVINPPGTLAYDDDFPIYDPFKYGPNPVFGWVEVDIDADETTGGELDYPEYRYVGAVARFGGMPTASACANRVAQGYGAFDGDVETPPWVERAGEEFHIAFRGEDIELISANGQPWCGSPGIFGAGDDWEIEGRLWHRAHGFEDFAFQCFAKQGRYKPLVRVKFKHDIATDLTTVSIVYPLTNAASASMNYPIPPTQPNDGCTSNQNSIEEALSDLKFSATHATAFSRDQPEFVLIGGWEYKTVSAHLNANNWRVMALLGTAYSMPKPEGASYIWTDVCPDVRVGDFNGDGQCNGLDVGLLNSFIAAHDGEAGFDIDGLNYNQSISLYDCAANFSVFDTSGDGIVNMGDGVVSGDMDLDQVVDSDDIAPFVRALLDPAGYSGSYGGVDPLLRGDLNNDGDFDGQDAQSFVQRLISQPLVRPDPQGD
jgi:hypothetical protein